MGQPAPQTTTSKSWAALPDLEVAVIILNYNGLRFLQTYLEGVVAHSGMAEVVVADNGSTDGSLAWLASEARFSEVRILDLGSNHGFSGGYNRAIAQCPYPYVVLLNSDVETPAGWLEPMMTFLKVNPLVAACQPKILSVASPDHFEFAGASGGFIDRLGYPYCRGRLFDTCERDLGQYDDAVQIFWATGACMLIRTDDYKSVGGLDEFFFAHMEEIDLCWRLAHKGRQVWVVPSAKVFHVGGGTLHKSNPRKTYLNFRNGLLLLYKNLPAKDLIPVIMERLNLDGVAGIKFLLSGKPKDCWSIVRAHFAFYASLGHYRKVRRQIRPEPMALKLPGIGQFSIVYRYFLEGVRRFSDL